MVFSKNMWKLVDIRILFLFNYMFKFYGMDMSGL